MSFLRILDNITEKNDSLLCVGLDIDLTKIKPLTNDNIEKQILDFNRNIIDQTKEFVCAYKPNIAFYEMYGIDGINALIKTIEHIPDDIPVILDAKRGDIGSTAKAYAKSIFENYNADAITVNPYLGFDSVEPFLNYKDKAVFVLCLTSNKSSADFQFLTDNEKPLYKIVAENVAHWNLRYGNCGLVVGATKAQLLKEIREIAQDMPILIPGVGAQGGDLETSVKFGITKEERNRAIINVSRSIIYSENPRYEANKIRNEINKFRK